MALNIVLASNRMTRLQLLVAWTVQQYGPILTVAGHHYHPKAFSYQLVYDNSSWQTS